MTITRRLWLTSACGGSLLLAQQSKRKVALRVRRSREEKVQAYEFVLESDRPFPVRALDPVLYVGEMVLESYRYQDGNFLVFATGEPAKLPQGAVVYFQYGNDTESRIDLGLYRGLTEPPPKK